MNTIKLQNTLKNFGFGFFFLFGFLLLSSTDVLAQRGRSSKESRKEYKREIKEERKERKEEIKAERKQRKQERKEDRYNDRYNDDDDRYDDDNDYNNGNDYRRNRNNIYRIAEQNGYNDGLREGAEDARDNDRYNPQGTSEYRRATSGYDYRYGNQGNYMQAYRQAFLRGYREGYDRYNQNW